MKYQFIEQYKQEFPVVTMCRVLSVSESGYYAWRKRPMSRRQREDARLSTHIQQVFVEYRGVYGSPRIHAELRDQGWNCSRKRIARLMQENGMDARRKRFRPITTKRNPKHPIAPNLLQQDFTASRPNEKWTGDITSIPTADGWLYLAVLLDVFSRRVIGWAMSEHCDELLVETALHMA
jgi:putative transposase